MTPHKIQQNRNTEIVQEFEKLSCNMIKFIPFLNDYFKDRLTNNIKYICYQIQDKFKKQFEKEAPIERTLSFIPAIPPIYEFSIIYEFESLLDYLTEDTEHSFAYDPSSISHMFIELLDTLDCFFRIKYNITLAELESQMRKNRYGCFKN